MKFVITPHLDWRSQRLEPEVFDVFRTVEVRDELEEVLLHVVTEMLEDNCDCLEPERDPMVGPPLRPERWWLASAQ